MPDSDLPSELPIILTTIVYIFSVTIQLFISFPGLYAALPSINSSIGSPQSTFSHYLHVHLWISILSPCIIMIISKMISTRTNQEPENLPARHSVEEDIFRCIYPEIVREMKKISEENEKVRREEQERRDAMDLLRIRDYLVNSICPKIVREQERIKKERESEEERERVRKEKAERMKAAHKELIKQATISREEIIAEEQESEKEMEKEEKKDTEFIYV